MTVPRVAIGIPLVCEVCDAEVSVEDSLAGPEVLCPRCRKLAAEVIQRVCEIMAVNPETVSIRTRFRDIDSVISCELLMELEDRYRVEFRERDRDGLRTVGDLIRLILVEKGEL